MYALTANEAKTQFGDLLLKAQREPVQINRNGKPVAVVMSVEDYQALEDLKLSALQQKIAGSSCGSVRWSLRWWRRCESRYSP